ncbi:hypothetical protein TrRE_jg906 [Triparma retinervis]|uniref:Uncharacterized protein n=1 Tax=Triparma retinervis TaxID=2557542 RepID=A0A9W6ZDH0_9STRA|nr:hypothetical protein TrRE_jg906 [Triparma retinervis]
MVFSSTPVEGNGCTQNACCHPTSCVKLADGPEGCDDMACTEIWYVGTVTICEMEGDVCVGYTPGGEGGSLIRVPGDGDEVPGGKCVVNQCCHPTDCLWAEETPDCDDVLCTMEYIEGTVSYCEFEDGECVGYDMHSIRVDGGGATFTPGFAVSFYFSILTLVVSAFCF